ncbi:hypothetical protein GGH96_004721 [Coemansia sp. RSA 1972]|nr:hypothetical protein GGH96_004721 [Coemansia sp. RSA 1972]
MKLALSLFVCGALVAALSDKEKTALSTFGKRYHPNDHAPTVLVSELSEYSTNAGLVDVSGNFGRKQYAQAGSGLEAHIRSISSDPLVQKGKQLAEPLMMLNECVTELKALYK